MVHCSDERQVAMASHAHDEHEDCDRTMYMEVQERRRQTWVGKQNESWYEVPDAGAKSEEQRAKSKTPERRAKNKERRTKSKKPQHSGDIMAT